MPYARRRRAPVRTGVSSNPVNTRGRKRYVKRRRYRKPRVRTNARKIGRLQHQVNKIRLKAYGHPQKCLQFADPIAPGATFSPWAQYPLLIHLSNLRAQSLPTNTGCPVFQVQPGGTVLQTIGEFKPVGNAFWNSANKDVCDTGQIYWRGMNFKTQIRGDRNLVDDVYVNITVFKYKPGNVQLIDPESGAGLILPTCLSELSDMCGRNTFNKSYFQTFRNKTVYLNSRTSTATPPAEVQRGTTGNLMYDTFSMEPKRIMTQAVTSTVAGEEQNISGIKGWQNVNTTVSQDLWMLVSTNLQYPASGTVTERIICDFSRTVYWRDMIGSGIA